MIDLLLIFILGMILPLLIVVALAFFLGMSERKGVTINPLDHYLRLIDWAYEKGSGER